MNDTALYLLIFAISVGLTMVVGRVLYASGEPFLTEVFGDEKVAASVNRLLAVLFHLLTLGVLALISSADMDVEGQAQAAVTKLGLMFLVIGGAHAIAMRVLIHARRRRIGDPYPQSMSQRVAQPFPQPPVQPVGYGPGYPPPGSPAAPSGWPAG